MLHYRLIHNLNVEVSRTNYTQVAKKYGVSVSSIHDVIKGKREPGPKLLAAMGLERIVSYRAVQA